MSWKVENHIASSREKKFRSRFPREYTSLLMRLQTVLNVLNEGIHPLQLRFGFLRSEGNGLYRLGQQRFPGSKESRMYFYFAISNGIIHVLGVGTKESQQKDIVDCKKQMDLIKRG